jgi:hypothetical protein
MARWVVAVVVAMHAALVAPPAAAACRFQLGFKAIADQIPAIVGQCLEDEHANPQNGDALQRTAGGLLVWRKADNFTAFTDGYRSWVNGPFGLQQRLNTEAFDWEARPAVAATPAVVAQGLVRVGDVCYEQGMEPGGMAETISRRRNLPFTPVPRDCAVPSVPGPSATLICRPFLGNIRCE